MVRFDGWDDGGPENRSNPDLLMAGVVVRAAAHGRRVAGRASSQLRTRSGVGGCGRALATGLEPVPGRRVADRGGAPARKSFSGMRCQAVVSVEEKSISGTMSRLRAENHVAFVPFVCAGDPDLDTTAKAIQELDRVGADVIELGVPYSDPLADGPTIQAAATRALERKTTLDDVIEMLARVAPTVKAPIVMFTYYNPIFARGLDVFCRQIKAAGASGLVVPDVPLEETADIRETCQEHGLELVLLTTPTTPESRMTRIAANTRGFLYLVSVTGVTGARTTIGHRVPELIKLLKGVTEQPICVGFGVSRPEQAKQIAAWGADGVIVGSALVRALGESDSPEQGLAAMSELAQQLKAALP